MRRDRIRAVAFDCYGTLVRVARPMGVRRQIRAIVGGRPFRSPITMDEPIMELVREAAPDAAPDLLATLDASIREEVASVELIPGALDSIAAFAGFDMALASNLSVEYAAPLWDLLPVGADHAIEFHVFSHDQLCAKPDARFFQTVCSRFAESPERVLMVSDSYASDYLGATLSGLHAVHVSANPLAGVPSVASVAALPEWFERNFP